jgi:ankyrin repeat protein
MPYLYPTGEYNFLNYKFSGFTLLHSSAKQLKYDIVDLLLTYGADVNIKEDGNTLAHNAA